MRYGMVIDLKRCIGCRACVVACKAENGTPPGMFWREVYQWEYGKYPRVGRTYLPRPCMHCKEPACLNVCPSGATQKRADGIVWVDHDKCIGCRYCINACPYDARYFLAKIRPYYPQGFTPYEEVMYQRFRTGVVYKCDFCKDRLDQGLNPACVDTCLAKACNIGDLDDPDSEVSRLIASRHGFQLSPEAGTEPSVYYLPP
ncbi:MAG: 4Fe-4S dicluster domain-containing protein [Chloroflexi bacterium]|nr:4Fe-4S dicluster domain-containing protein [Chloroflexota bacterium]